MISIAIPAHNEELSIQRTLGSVAGSDFKKNRFEIIICLSACTDDTRQEIEKFKRDNGNIDIKIIESRKIGKVLAIKKLDKYIKNRVIVFLDADCSPLKESIYMVYSDLINSDKNIKAVSGNTIDPRYINKNQKPKNFTDVFNRAFWQRTGRKIINGPLFSIRKGVIQDIPDDIISEDTYLSLILWDQFLNNSKAKVIQGSSQSVSEYIKYQRNFQAAYLQICNYLRNTPKFDDNFKELSGQFDVLLSNKDRYYPNLTYIQLLFVNVIITVGKVWGLFIKATWNQTKSSKAIAD